MGGKAFGVMVSLRESRTAKRVAGRARVRRNGTRAARPRVVVSPALVAWQSPFGKENKVTDLTLFSVRES